MFKISQFFDENPWRNKSSKLNIFGPLFSKTHSAVSKSKEGSRKTHLQTRVQETHLTRVQETHLQTADKMDTVTPNSWSTCTPILQWPSDTSTPTLKREKLFLKIYRYLLCLFLLSILLSTFSIFQEWLSGWRGRCRRRMIIQINQTKL